MKKTFILKDYEDIKEMIAERLRLKKETVRLCKSDDELSYTLSHWTGYIDCLLDMGLIDIEQWTILKFDGNCEIIESYFNSRK